MTQLWNRYPYCKVTRQAGTLLRFPYCTRGKDGIKLPRIKGCEFELYGRFHVLLRTSFSTMWCFWSISDKDRTMKNSRKISFGELKESSCGPESSLHHRNYWDLKSGLRNTHNILSTFMLYLNGRQINNKLKLDILRWPLFLFIINSWTDVVRTSGRSSNFSANAGCIFFVKNKLASIFDV